MGVIAVDPSSRRSGGALLGDRGAAADRSRRHQHLRPLHGGAGPAGRAGEETYAAMILMRAVFDLVLVETVGVGQSRPTSRLPPIPWCSACKPRLRATACSSMRRPASSRFPDIVVVTKGRYGEGCQIGARSNVKGAWDLTAEHGLSRRVPVQIVAGGRHRRHHQATGEIAAHWHWLQGENRPGEQLWRLRPRATEAETVDSRNALETGRPETPRQLSLATNTARHLVGKRPANGRRPRSGRPIWKGSWGDGERL